MRDGDVFADGLPSLRTIFRAVNSLGWRVAPSYASLCIYIHTCCIYRWFFFSFSFSPAPFCLSLWIGSSEGHCRTSRPENKNTPLRRFESPNKSVCFFFFLFFLFSLSLSLYFLFYFIFFPVCFICLSQSFLSDFCPVRVCVCVCVCVCTSLSHRSGLISLGHCLLSERHRL